MKIQCPCGDVIMRGQNDDGTSGANPGVFTRMLACAKIKRFRTTLC